MLASARRRHDLLGMLRVRAREDDRVDARIGERRRVVGGERDTVGDGERLRRLAGAADAGGEPDLVGLAVGAVDQVLAPAAEADDRRADHAGTLLSG